MCLCPQCIPNPWYGKNRVASYAKTAWRHDCESAFIYIPCGVCRECVALKQMYLVQRVQMEAQDCFLFFTTLTYDDAHLPHYICDNGVSIPFADTQHLQLLFKRLRNDNAFGRPFRYLAVSERGTNRGRPHPFSYFMVSA